MVKKAARAPPRAKLPDGWTMVADTLAVCNHGHRVAFDAAIRRGCSICTGGEFYGKLANILCKFGGIWAYMRPFGRKHYVHESTLDIKIVGAPALDDKPRGTTRKDITPDIVVNTRCPSVDGFETLLGVEVREKMIVLLSTRIRAAVIVPVPTGTQEMLTACIAWRPAPHLEVDRAISMRNEAFRSWRDSRAHTALTWNVPGSLAADLWMAEAIKYTATAESLVDWSTYVKDAS